MSNTTLLLVAIAVMMLVAVPVAIMMKDFLPGFVLRSAGLETLENRIYVLHSQAQDVQERVNVMVQRRNQVAGDKHRIDTDNRKMERAIAEIAEQPPLFVHEVGDPQAGLTKFVVTIAQEKASAAARAAGERAQVNPIWRCANVAEVWATNMEEAKQLVEIAFPFKMGFTTAFPRSAVPRKAGAPRAKATAT